MLNLSLWCTPFLTVCFLLQVWNAEGFIWGKCGTAKCKILVWVKTTRIATVKSVNGLNLLDYISLILLKLKTVLSKNSSQSHMWKSEVRHSSTQPAMSRKSERDRTDYTIAQFSKDSAGEITRLDYIKSLGYRFLARTDM